jgi:proteasome accessory factor B
MFKSPSKAMKPMSKPPEQTNTRSQMDRIWQIHSTLAEQTPINCTRLSDKLEVNRRTILRDLDFMRDRLNLPIEYDDRRKTFYYSKEVTSFPALTINSSEMMALKLAQHTLSQYTGSPFSSNLQAALDKISRLTGLNTLAGQLPATVKAVGPTKLDTANFEILEKAVKQRQPIKFTYRRLGEAGKQVRQVHPYHIACIKGRWYLAAFDLKRQEMRTFALSRMEKLLIQAGRFEVQIGFDANQYFNSGFSVMHGEGDYLVEVEFNRWGADLLQTSVWHPTQKIKKIKDGGIRLTMRLDSLEEVTGWLLSWGEHATVVQPVELRQRLYEITNRLAERYHP